MKNVFLFFTILFSVFVQAQSNETVLVPKEVSEANSSEMIILQSNELLTFEGEDFRKHFVTNYKYPIDAVQDEISGTIVIDFVVGADGFVDDLKVVRSLCETCDKEAIRVIKKTKFKPCEEKGEDVRCRYNFPIKLSL